MLTAGATFEDLIIRVAELVDQADYGEDEDSTDNRARIPTDQHVLDKIKRAINDTQKLINLDWAKWGGLRALVYILCDPNAIQAHVMYSNPAWMLLPAYVRGAAIERWSWTYPSSSTGGDVPDVHESFVRKAFASSPNAKGPPQMISCQPALRVGTPGLKQEQGNAWSIRVFPTPDQAYLLINKFPASPTPLVGMTDRHLFGEHLDEALVEGAAGAYRRGSDKAGAHMDRFAMLVGKARALELSWGPESVGVVTNPDRPAGGWGPDGRIIVDGVVVG